MPDVPHETVTALLLRWRQGDNLALDQLVPMVYAELRRVARAHLRGARNPSLQPTALVHELYLRLADSDGIIVRDRPHFFAIAARVMRQVLVDHARRRLADKRGGSVTIIGLEMTTEPATPPGVDVLVIDEALDQLQSVDARLCRVVELRFFGGLNINETAEAIGVSPATVERDWAMAKAWLFQRLSPRSERDHT
jgi:RNA polymerase sigma factor (TIGR02999 family)